MACPAFNTLILSFGDDRFSIGFMESCQLYETELAEMVAVGRATRRATYSKNHSMLGIISSILAATIPLTALHWYLARSERRHLPERQLGQVDMPRLPIVLRLQNIYIVIPAYIGVLGLLGLFLGVWLYARTAQTRVDLINASPILAFSVLTILVCAIWFFLAIAQRLTITKADITFSYGLGTAKVDLLDVSGYTERSSFIFIRFKTARKDLAIPTSFQGLDILAKVLAGAKHGRIYL